MRGPEGEGAGGCRYQGLSVLRGGGARVYGCQGDVGAVGCGYQGIQVPGGCGYQGDVGAKGFWHLVTQVPRHRGTGWGSVPHRVPRPRGDPARQSWKPSWGAEPLPSRCWGAWLRGGWGGMAGEQLPAGPVVLALLGDLGSDDFMALLRTDFHPGREHRVAVICHGKLLGLWGVSACCHTRPRFLHLPPWADNPLIPLRLKATGKVARVPPPSLRDASPMTKAHVCLTPINLRPQLIPNPPPKKKGRATRVNPHPTLLLQPRGGGSWGRGRSCYFNPVIFILCQQVQTHPL